MLLCILMGEQLLINSIYRATEGEGIHLGQAQVFIRFQGCQVGCLNCDSKETWEFTRESALDMSQVLEQVERQSLTGKIRRVSLTGGDPLHPRHVPGLRELVGQLKQRGYWSNLEASGTRIVPPIFRAVDFISFDYKPPSTGVHFPLRNLAILCEEYPGKFQVKSVVEDVRDFRACEQAYQFLQERGLGDGFQWCLTPAFNNHEDFNPARFIEIMSLNYQSNYPFRVIGQQHKWVYGPREKCV